MNAITSFMDASVVYGHTPKMESSLRDPSSLNGKLVVNRKFKDHKGRPYLPFVNKHSGCRQDSKGERVECFHAGDSRVNEVIGLTILHTLWMREHNRIAEAFKHINGHWNPETIYQETRKIIGAAHQVCDHYTVLLLYTIIKSTKVKCFAWRMLENNVHLDLFRKLQRSDFFQHLNKID